MISLKNKAFLSLLVIASFLFCISFLLGCLLGHQFTMHSKNPDELQIGSLLRVGSFGNIVTVWGGPYLTIQISPHGYPSPGTKWEISIFEVLTSECIHTPALNSNVTISVLLENGEKEIYEYLVDENAKLLFEYRPEYADVAFQAHKNDIHSEKIILTEHFHSLTNVENLRLFNGFTLLLTIPGGISLFRGKAKKILTVVFIITLFVNAFTASFLTLAIQQSTAWGIPEVLSSGFITINLLKLTSAVGFLLVIALWITMIIANVLLQKNRR